MVRKAVTLEEMLSARERRARIQEELLAKYGKPLVSFTMNIPGEYKYDALIEFAFRAGLQRLTEAAGEPAAQTVLAENTGCEAFMVFDAPAEELKAKAVEIEETAPFGRAYDIDIIGTDGAKLSRAVSRKCYVCGGPVFECSRSRAHGLDEIVAACRSLLEKAAAAELAGRAVEALKAEARLTPKPGLVDSANSGAHSDMDLALLLKSAEALGPYFKRAAELGLKSGRNAADQEASAAGPEAASDIFAKAGSALQQEGLKAEAAMFKATGGVNTHKGAVFSLGILCCAKAAELQGAGNCFDIASKIAAGTVKSSAATHGNLVAEKLGARGARQQAVDGFPLVKEALGVLQSGAEELDALLLLMSKAEDTNLLWRGGAEGLTYVREESKRIMAQPKEQRTELLKAMDKECIKRRLSPGGCADLLACAIFLS